LWAVTGLVALAPFTVVAAARERPAAAALRAIVPAFLLGAAGVLLLPPPTGLAAAAVLLCLDLGTRAPSHQSRRSPRTREPRSREALAALALQQGWLGFLLAGGALAAAYPWVRPRPLDAALAILGLPASAEGTATAATSMATLAGAAVLLAAARFGSMRRTVFLLVVGLAVAALAAQPRAAVEVAPPEGVELTAAEPHWSTRLDGPVGQIRLISSLGDAASLPAGTPVATLSLERGGRSLATWPLRAGHETAEWAADRPDLRGSTARGMAWWSWVPPPGTFLAHVYAATWRPARSLAATRVRVVRAGALPAGVTLSLVRVEVTP
jgi:hypothetical protein